MKAISNINVITDTRDIKTYPIMTQGEFLAILCRYTTALYDDGDVLVETDSSFPKEIALQALKEKKLPFIISRKLQDGSYEHIPCSLLKTKYEKIFSSYNKITSDMIADL